MKRIEFKSLRGFEVCCLMFNIRNLMCLRNKMKNLSKVSEHFPLWRGAGGGFSFTNNIIKKYSLDFIPNTSAKVRNQKLEIRMNAIIGAPHSTSNIQNSTFIPFITHYPLLITNYQLPITHYSSHITFRP